jgi:hypothetical protein
MTAPLDLVWFALSPNLPIVVLVLASLAAVVLVAALIEGHRTP